MNGPSKLSPRPNDIGGLCAIAHTDGQVQLSAIEFPVKQTHSFDETYLAAG